MSEQYDLEGNVIEVQKTIVEVITRQHEIYANLTATGLQFPINLVLTLNSSAFAALLVFDRVEFSATGTPPPFLTTAAFVFFALGIASVLMAAVFQWQLYETVMHRKRRLLEAALKETSFARAMKPFRFEAEDFGKTYKGYWCFAFTVLSYAFLMIGVHFAAVAT